jgi:hypothetical protein
MTQSQRCSRRSIFWVFAILFHVFFRNKRRMLWVECLYGTDKSRVEPVRSQVIAFTTINFILRHEVFPRIFLAVVIEFKYFFFSEVFSFVSSFHFIAVFFFLHF